MSEANGPPAVDVSARLDEIMREVRRLGRATVAAQAAAESCLEALQREERAADGPAPAEGGDQWLRALLPFADALDRMTEQADAMAARREPPARPSRLAWLLPGRAPARDAGADGHVAALAEGLRLLRAQLTAAFEGVGVTIDRRVGVPVDPEAHQVVEVRAGAAVGRPPGHVIEVVRPGYSLGGRRLREADVVAMGGDAPDVKP
ncbi:MAG: nucleotide exchange factor GrpE [Polyangiaceae bacterium]|jgi:molecular chaperone GrpE|nr:nucleotide exchange factor GrpE [Polyangiaceae bacterium]